MEAGGPVIHGIVKGRIGLRKLHVWYIIYLENGQYKRGNFLGVTCLDHI